MSRTLTTALVVCVLLAGRSSRAQDSAPAPAADPAPTAAPAPEQPLTAPATQVEAEPPASSSPGASSRGLTLYAFFATWCVPCRVEIPHVERLHRQYAERGLKVVFVSEDAPSSAQQIPGFLARYNVTASWILDNESEILERYNPTASLPFTVMLDAGGGVVFSHAGYEPGDERVLEAAVVKQLSGHETGTARPARTSHVTTTTQVLGVFRETRFRTEDARLQGLIGRVEVAGYTEKYSAAVRVDTSLVSDDLMKEGLNRTGNHVALERARVSAQLGPARIQLGDDYVAFGHGVSLSLRKIDPLGLDTALRGVRVDAKQGGVKVRALAGYTNPQNSDRIDFEYTDREDEKTDLLAGAEVSFPVGQVGHVAPYILYAAADGAGSGGEDLDWSVGGASTSLAFGDLNFAMEAAGGLRNGKTLLNDGRENAWAVYSAVQWKLGDVTVLLDSKAYRHWAIGRQQEQLAYHEPPSLEREDQFVRGSEDVLGVRARVEWRITPSSSVFANALAYSFSNDDDLAPADGERALHGYVGGEKRLADGKVFGLQAGYRDENNAMGEDYIKLWHVDVDATSPIDKRWAVTMKMNHVSEEKSSFKTVSFVRGLGSIGISRTGWGALSFLYGYTTEDATTPVEYPAGELVVHLRRGSDLRLFVGRLAGGFVCVSGSCRQLPPFEGARLDLAIRL